MIPSPEVEAEGSNEAKPGWEKSSSGTKVVPLPAAAAGDFRTGMSDGSGWSGSSATIGSVNGDYSKEMNHRGTEITEKTVEKKSADSAVSDLCASVSLWLRFRLLPPDFLPRITRMNADKGIDPVGLTSALSA